MSTDAATTPEPSAVRHRIDLERQPRGVVSSLPLRVHDRPIPVPPAPPPVDCTPFVLAVRDAADELRGQFQALLGEVEQECVALACDAAGRLVDHEISADRCDLTRPLTELIERYRESLESARVTVSLHPDDLAAIEPGLDQAASLLPILELRADASLERGAIVLDSGETRIVRSLAADLRELRIALQGGQQT